MPAMLNYNEVKPGVIITLEGEPYVCTWNNIMQKQQRRPVNQTKLRHLIKGNVIEYSFQQSDKLDEADIGSRELKYLYTNRGESWFSDPQNPKERIKFDEDFVAHALPYLRENDMVTGVTFEGNIVSIKLPIKVELKVVEAPPDVRGNTAQGGSKIVTLETGATITTPMFVKEGDVIRINTETGEYVERV
jgi:elongation factor P